MGSIRRAHAGSGRPRIDIAFVFRTARATRGRRSEFTTDIAQSFGVGVRQDDATGGGLYRSRAAHGRNLDFNVRDPTPHNRRPPTGIDASRRFHSQELVRLAGSAQAEYGVPPSA